MCGGGGEIVRDSSEGARKRPGGSGRGGVEMTRQDQVTRGFELGWILVKTWECLPRTRE